jgi:hypothetical protein
MEDKKNDCYCCSCGYDNDDNLVSWDPACHNHGAHGGRGCEKHNVEPENCSCGCDYKVYES